jgi:hypothetical protein
MWAKALRTGTTRGEGQVAFPKAAHSRCDHDAEQANAFETVKSDSPRIYSGRGKIFPH